MTGQLKLQDFKEYAERVFANIPSGLIILSTRLRILTVNRAFLRMFDVPSDAVERRHALEVIEAEGFGDQLSAVLGGATARADGMLAMRVCGGDSRLIRYAVTGMYLAEEEEEEEEARLLIALEDITEQERAFQDLARSEARLAEAQRIARLGHWEWNVRSGALWWSDEVYRILGRSRETFLATIDSFLARLHPDDRIRVESEIIKSLKDGSDYRIDHRILLPGGDVRHVHEQARCIRGADGNVERMVGTVQDITERKESEARLFHLAHHDPLTSLPNRMLLRDRIIQAIAYGRRHDRLVAVLFLDLDHFKRINDSLGHAVGDRLLQAIADRLRKTVRDGDTVARLGGDEFAIALTDVADPDDVAKLASKLLVTINQPVTIDERNFRASASIGISLFPHDGCDVETLLKNADTAMYEAKDAGRNAYRFFREEMDLNIRSHLELEQALQVALERGEFEVRYQPQIRLGDDVQGGTNAAGAGCTGAVDGLEGAEALLRWNRPDDKTIGPDQFIPILEETGLIVEVGAWVLRQACVEAVRWHKRLDRYLTVAVNLSRRQFDDAGLVDTVRQVLQETGLPANYLELEVTEGVVMPDPIRAGQVMQELREIGVRLAMDDFGTGYSSLVYLKRFPLDRLKIDKEFIRDIGVDPNDDAIVRTIITLAANLDLEVVAEGVETEVQRDFLRQQGCQYAQGYLYSRPLSLTELDGFFSDKAVFTDSRR
ncbi:EAL domain-containing protein [Shewanella indica]|uniref:EAL domain-containing protein n=1 Tax=Shewanella indica TaxID=768528 RepID=A0ABU4QGX9_9GAMM|nr:EAL domain-containing protein [Shewanella indica]MDX6018596.1 EAL domain-containing protein [Shewanella indica]MDX6018677.1 EAL domain-containing protein [Shewanella indica]